MSETIGTPHGAATETVHEAYSFACLSCGHGWEQSYEIAHHTDEAGHTTVVYYAAGQRVPSPLTRPTCLNCGEHLVRIMRSGRVSNVSWEHRTDNPVSAQGLLTLPDAGPYGGSYAGPFTLAGGRRKKNEREERAERADEAEEAEEDRRQAERPDRDRPRRSWWARLIAFLRRHRGEDRAA